MKDTINDHLPVKRIGQRLAHPLVLQKRMIHSETDHIVDERIVHLQ